MPSGHGSPPVIQHSGSRQGIMKQAGWPYKPYWTALTSTERPCLNEQGGEQVRKTPDVTSSKHINVHSVLIHMQTHIQHTCIPIHRNICKK